MSKIQKCLRNPIKSLNQGSIILQLFLLTLAVFIIMLLLTTSLLRWKQASLVEQVITQLDQSMLDASGSEQEQLTLIINEAQLRSTGEYRVFAILTLASSIFLGGCILAWTINRLLGPIRQLNETIKSINLASLDQGLPEIKISQGSRELRELSESFYSALKTIAENYEKERLFSVNVAHELRTPLAILSTKIHVFRLSQTDMPEDLAAFVQSLETNVSRLSQLVEAILILGREDQQNRQKVQVSYLVEEIFLDLEDQARTKQQQLVLEGEDLVLETDDQLLERVLFNLLENALKYSPAGSTCTVNMLAKPEAYVIQVLDEGKGLSPEEREKVFDLFYRTDEARDRKEGGFGIGLALVRDLVHRLGGSIQALPREPQGSPGLNFQIEFPRE